MKKLNGILKYISIPVIIGGLWFIFDLDQKATASDSRSKANEDAILQQAILANKVNDQFELLLKLGGISDQTYEKLRMLPTAPYDKEGNYNPEWVLVNAKERVIYVIRMPDTCGTILKIPIGE